jgi:ATP-binding cassette subfamily C protein CydC
MVMLLLFSAAVFEATGGISVAMHLLPAAAASAERITELSAAKPPVAEPASPLPLPTEFSLNLNNVTFSYDGISQVLSGLTFELPAGSRVALTGASGSGKSTVAEILLRFRDYHGSITIGGTELRSLSADELRQVIAFLPQKPHLFNTTIRENILLAKPGATDTELTALLRDTMLDVWVEKLPEGLETRVGEGGCAVSGGEARRIALARALLKDAPLVILDEPTEGLDTETERVLLERVGRRLNGKSLLLISHRPAPLALADRVIIMD